MNSPASILDKLGRHWQWSAYVVAVRFDAGNRLAFALSDGSVRVVNPGDETEPTRIDAHDGAVLSLDRAPRTGFLSGGDDGRFLRLGTDGTLEEIAHFPGRWIDHVTSHSSGIEACSEGKRLHLYPKAGDHLVREFPSTVGGIAFAPNGYRVAVGHYGGVTLCSTRSAGSPPRLLTCPGSHLSVTWSPDARFVLSAMQEDCIRGWRLEDDDDLMMRGYSAKVHSWCWVNGGRHLATSGSDCAPCWPFKGRKGPSGQSPLTPGESSGSLVTAVAGDPKRPLLAIGYDDGRVVVAELRHQREAEVVPAGNGPVTRIDWSPNGEHLAFGTETGFAGLLPVSAW